MSNKTPPSEITPSRNKSPYIIKSGSITFPSLFEVFDTQIAKSTSRQTAFYPNEEEF